MINDDIQQNIFSFPKNCAKSSISIEFLLILQQTKNKRTSLFTYAVVTFGDIDFRTFHFARIAANVNFVSVHCLTVLNTAIFRYM